MDWDEFEDWHAVKRKFKNSQTGGHDIGQWLWVNVFQGGNETVVSKCDKWIFQDEPLGLVMEAASMDQEVLKKLGAMISNRLMKGYVRLGLMKLYHKIAATTNDGKQEIDLLESVLMNEAERNWKVMEQSLRYLISMENDQLQLSTEMRNRLCVLGLRLASRNELVEPVHAAAVEVATKFYTGELQNGVEEDDMDVDLLLCLARFKDHPAIIDGFRRSLLDWVRGCGVKKNEQAFRVFAGHFTSSDVNAVLEFINDSDDYWFVVPILCELKREDVNLDWILPAISISSSRFFPKLMKDWMVTETELFGKHADLVEKTKSRARYCLRGLKEHIVTTTKDWNVFLAVIGWTALCPAPDGLDFPWGDDECERLAKAINAHLDPEEITRQEMFWVFLRDRLGQGKWKETEWQTTASLVAIIRNIKRPAFLSLETSENVLGHILPMVLPLVDHLSEKVHLTGLALLRNIIHEMTMTEFRWHASLLLEKLQTHIVASREPLVLQQALPAWFEAISKAEPVAYPFPRHTDALENVLLNKLRYSCPSSGEARLELLVYVKLFMVQMGQTIIPYVEDLLKVVYQSTCVKYEPERMVALEILQCILTTCTERIKYHQNLITAIFAKHRVMTQYQRNKTDTEKQLTQTLYRQFTTLADKDTLERDLARLEPFVKLD